MVDKSQRFILWFDEIGMEDVPLVGGKSASLGEMIRRAKVPVPYGFATTALAYRHFVEKTGIREKISEVLSQLKDPNDTATLQRVGSTVRRIIKEAKMPEDLEKMIRRFYEELGRRSGEKEPFVAIRSSATEIGRAHV